MSKKMLAIDWMEMTGMFHVSPVYSKIIDDYYTEYLMGRNYQYDEMKKIDVDGRYYLDKFNTGDRIHLLRCNLSEKGEVIARISGIGRAKMQDRRHFGMTFENRFLWENLGTSFVHYYGIVGSEYSDRDKNYPRITRVDYSIDGFEKSEALEFVERVLQEIEYKVRQTQEIKSTIDGKTFVSYYWGSRSARLQVIVYDKNFDIMEKPWIKKALEENEVDVAWRVEFRLNAPTEEFNKSILCSILKNEDVLDTVVKYKNMNAKDDSVKEPNTESFVKHLIKVFHFLHYFDVKLEEVFDSEFEKYAAVEYKKFKYHYDHQNIKRDGESFCRSVCVTVKEMRRKAKGAKSEGNKERSKKSDVSLRKYVLNDKQEIDLSGKMITVDQKQNV